LKRHARADHNNEGEGLTQRECQEPTAGRDNARPPQVSSEMFKRTGTYCVFLIVVISMASGSCSRQQTPPQPKPGQTSSTSPNAAVDRDTLVVSAAASTKDLIEALTQRFSANTGTEVKVNTGPSNGLANQIIAGAPVDLFLSANQQWADEVKKSGNAHEMTRLLTNRLVIVVPADNPGRVKEPKDLLSDRVQKVALAGDKVPAGIYAGQALAKLGILDELDAAKKIVRGQDVRFTLSYVERSEAEAGIVYSTDVAAATGVKIAHEFDPSLHDEIVYVLVLLKHAGDKPKAQELYQFLQSKDSDSTYAEFGFSRQR
jgi:molybdate transport system substrate-binding protein